MGDCRIEARFRVSIVKLDADPIRNELLAEELRVGIGFWIVFNHLVIDESEKLVQRSNDSNSLAFNHSGFTNHL